MSSYASQYDVLRFNSKQPTSIDGGFTPYLSYNYIDNTKDTLRDYKQRKLEMFTGVSTNTRKKKEFGQIFKPVKETKTIGSSYFIGDTKDRYHVSKEKKYQTPHEPVVTGPGIGLGYSNTVRSGQDLRILPKSIDETRQKNKQQVSYPGPVLPPQRVFEERNTKPNIVSRAPPRFQELDIQKQIPRHGIESSKIRDNFHLTATNRAVQKNSISFLSGTTNKTISQGINKLSSKNDAPALREKNLQCVSQPTIGKTPKPKNKTIKISRLERIMHGSKPMVPQGMTLNNSPQLHASNHTSASNNPSIQVGSLLSLASNHPSQGRLCNTMTNSMPQTNSGVIQNKPGMGNKINTMPDFNSQVRIPSSCQDTKVETIINRVQGTNSLGHLPNANSNVCLSPDTNSSMYLSMPVINDSLPLPIESLRPTSSSTIETRNMNVNTSNRQYIDIAARNKDYTMPKMAYTSPPGLANVNHENWSGINSVKNQSSVSSFITGLIAGSKRKQAPKISKLKNNPTNALVKGVCKTRESNASRASRASRGLRLATTTNRVNAGMNNNTQGPVNGRVINKKTNNALNKYIPPQMRQSNTTRSNKAPEFTLRQLINTVYTSLGLHNSNYTQQTMTNKPRQNKNSARILQLTGHSKKRVKTKINLKPQDKTVTKPNTVTGNVHQRSRHDANALRLNDDKENIIKTRPPNYTGVNDSRHFPETRLANDCDKLRHRKTLL